MLRLFQKNKKRKSEDNLEALIGKKRHRSFDSSTGPLSPQALRQDNIFFVRSSSNTNRNSSKSDGDNIPHQEMSSRNRLTLFQSRRRRECKTTHNTVKYSRWWGRRQRGMSRRERNQHQLVPTSSTFNEGWAVEETTNSSVGARHNPLSAAEADASPIWSGENDDDDQGFAEAALLQAPIGFHGRCDGSGTQLVRRASSTGLGFPSSVESGSISEESIYFRECDQTIHTELDDEQNNHHSFHFASSPIRTTKVFDDSQSSPDQSLKDFADELVKARSLSRDMFDASYPTLSSIGSLDKEEEEERGHQEARFPSPVVPVLRGILKVPEGQELDIPVLCPQLAEASNRASSQSPSVTCSEPGTASSLIHTTLLVRGEHKKEKPHLKNIRFDENPPHIHEIESTYVLNQTWNERKWFYLIVVLLGCVILLGCGVLLTMLLVQWVTNMGRAVHHQSVQAVQVTTEVYVAIATKTRRILHLVVGVIQIVTVLGGLYIWFLLSRGMIEELWKALIRPSTFLPQASPTTFTSNNATIVTAGRAEDSQTTNISSQLSVSTKAAKHCPTETATGRKDSNLLEESPWKASLTMSREKPVVLQATPSPIDQTKPGISVESDNAESNNISSMKPVANTLDEGCTTLPNTEPPCMESEIEATESQGSLSESVIMKSNSDRVTPETAAAVSPDDGNDNWSLEPLYSRVTAVSDPSTGQNPKPAPDEQGDVIPDRIRQPTSPTIGSSGNDKAVSQLVGSKESVVESRLYANRNDTVREAMDHVDVLITEAAQLDRFEGKSNKPQITLSNGTPNQDQKQAECANLSSSSIGMAEGDLPEVKASELEDSENGSSSVPTRKKRIQEELASVMKEIEDEELEEEMEPEAVEALQNATLKTAYRKQYHDVLNDRMVHRMSVAKTREEDFNDSIDEPAPVEKSSCDSVKNVPMQLDMVSTQTSGTVDTLERLNSIAGTPGFDASFVYATEETCSGSDSFSLINPSSTEAQGIIGITPGEQDKNEEGAQKHERALLTPQRGVKESLKSKNIIFERDDSTIPSWAKSSEEQSNSAQMSPSPKIVAISLMTATPMTPRRSLNREDSQFESSKNSFIAALALATPTRKKEALTETERTPRTLKGGFVAINTATPRRDGSKSPPPKRFNDQSSQGNDDGRSYVHYALAVMRDKSKAAEVQKLVQQIESLEGFPKTRRLSMRDNELVSHLVMSIRNDPRITKVHADPAAFGSISSTLLTQFVDSLRLNLHVNSLSFQGVELGNDFLYALSTSMDSNFAVQSINLSVNCFTNEGLAAFCQNLALNNESVIALNLKNQTTPISIASEEDVLDAFQQNTSLIDVQLDFQSEEGTKKLAKILDRSCSNMKSKERKPNSDDKLLGVLSYEVERAQEAWENKQEDEVQTQFTDRDWSYLYELAVLFDKHKLREEVEESFEKDIAPRRTNADDLSKEEKKEFLFGAFKKTMEESVSCFNSDGSFLTDDFISSYFKENAEKGSLEFDFHGHWKLFKRFPVHDPARQLIVDKFVDAIVTHPRAVVITGIDMANTGCGDDFLTALCQRCLDDQTLLPSLHSINFETNFINEIGVTALAKLIADCDSCKYMQVIRLENQKGMLKSKAEFALAKALRVNRSVVVVSLAIRNLLERERIGKYIVRNVDYLREARQRHMKATGTQRKRNRVELFFDRVLADDESVTKVNMTGNARFLSLTKEEKLKAASSLAQNTNVKEVMLNSCGLDDEFARALSTSIATNTSMEKLSLESNDISGQGIKAIFEGLARNSSIRELRLHKQSKVLASADEESLAGLFEGNLTIIKLGMDLRSQMAQVQLDRKASHNKNLQLKERAEAKGEECVTEDRMSAIKF